MDLGSEIGEGLWKDVNENARSKFTHYKIKHRLNITLFILGKTKHMPYTDLLPYLRVP